MTNSDSIAEKNWRVLVEAYNLRQKNEAQAQTDPADIPHPSGSAVAAHVLHRGRFPHRLRVTSIAE